MGAQPWSYFVPFEADVRSALQKLRTREFKAGRFTCAGLNKASRPATIDEVMEMCGETGSQSILDIYDIMDTPHQRSDEGDFDPDRLAKVAPLDNDDLVELFGTAQPTHDQIESNCDLYDRINRGEGVYIVAFKGGKPSEYYFVGYSFD